MPKSVTPREIEELIESATDDLRSEEAERREAGSRRPEEPGLTGEARHFQIDF